MVTQSMETSRPRILRAASIVMAFFVASRALGLVRDIVISHQFGTSRELDAYFAAFSITDLIFNVIAGGALGSAFIPTFSAALASGTEYRAWRLASSIINISLAVLTLTAALAAVFAPQLVSMTVASGFSYEDQQLTATLLRLMLVTPIIFGLSGILMGILNSFQHFVLPALAPVVYNAAIILAAIFLSPGLGVYGLAIGVVAGSFLHLLVQVPWLARKMMRYTFEFGIKNDDVRQVGKLMLPRTAGLAAVHINFLINTILASGLPAGRIAALGYAWRLMLLPEGIIALSLATAVFPTLSLQNARKEMGEFSQTFVTAFRTTLYLTIPAAVGLIILGRNLIALLFERGEFDALSTGETYFALKFYALGLVAHSGLEIVTRAFYAMHDTKTPVIMSIGSVILNILLSMSLVLPLAQGGLALANSAATTLELILLFAILRSRIGSLWDSRLTISIGRSVVGTLVMALFLLLLVSLTEQYGDAFTAVLGVVCGAVIYLSVTTMLGSQETVNLLRRVRQLPPVG